MSIRHSLDARHCEQRSRPQRLGVGGLPLRQAGDQLAHDLPEGQSREAPLRLQVIREGEAQTPLRPSGV